MRTIGTKNTNFSPVFLALLFVFVAFTVAVVRYPELFVTAASNEVTVHGEKMMVTEHGIQTASGSHVFSIDVDIRCGTPENAPIVIAGCTVLPRPLIHDDYLLVANSETGHVYGMVYIDEENRGHYLQGEWWTTELPIAPPTQWRQFGDGRIEIMFDDHVPVYIDPRNNAVFGGMFQLDRGPDGDPPLHEPL